MTEEPKDSQKMVDKMRANTEKQKRGTNEVVWKRARKKVPKARQQKPVDQSAPTDK